MSRTIRDRHARRLGGKTPEDGRSGRLAATGPWNRAGRTVNVALGPLY